MLVCFLTRVTVQGIVGSTPWNAMVFFTLWLQLLGFSDYSASLLMALFAGGCAIGSALGGFLGKPHTHSRGEDLVAKWLCLLEALPLIGTNVASWFAAMNSSS